MAYIHQSTMWKHAAVDLKQLLGNCYTGLIFSAESLKLAYRERAEIIGSLINLTSERFFSYLRHLLTDWYSEE